MIEQITTDLDERWLLVADMAEDALSHVQEVAPRSMRRAIQRYGQRAVDMTAFIVTVEKANHFDKPNPKPSLFPELYMEDVRDSINFIARFTGRGALHRVCDMRHDSSKAARVYWKDQLVVPGFDHPIAIEDYTETVWGPDYTYRFMEAYTQQQVEIQEAIK